MRPSSKRRRKATRTGVRTSVTIEQGDVVLGRLGHKFWPALASEVCSPQASPTSCHKHRVRLIFFGDHKELTVTTGLARPAIRPFEDLARLSSRERPTCMLYETALEEARRWQASRPMPNTSEPTQSAADDGTWSISGAVIPHALMLRAAARRLPPRGEVPSATPSPPATSRVLAPSCTSQLLLSNTNALDNELTEVDCEDAASDDEEDLVDDGAFARRHAPYEELEMRGFAAHPSIGVEMHEEEPGKSVPQSSARAGSRSSCTRKSGRSVTSPCTESLVGRQVLVPALAFPPEALPMGCAALHFEGEVTGVTARTRCEFLNVYFKSDHTICLFSRQQVRQWLVPNSAPVAESKPSASVSRGKARGHARARAVRRGGTSRQTLKNVRLCLAGVTWSHLARSADDSAA
jgi:hypothetical protein